MTPPAALHSAQLRVHPTRGHMTTAPALLLLLMRNRFVQHLCTRDFPATYLSHVAMTSRLGWGGGGGNLEVAFLFTVRDGVDKVALLLVKQCYQRSVTVDTELQDGISESVYHRHNSSTLLVN